MIIYVSLNNDIRICQTYAYTYLRKSTSITTGPQAERVTDHLPPEMAGAIHGMGIAGMTADS